MKKISLIALVGVVTLVIGGCSLFQKKSEDTEATTEQTQPKTANPPSQAQNSGQSAQTKKTAKSSGVGGLIPPVNPEQRRAAIKQGRSDPFALIPVQPEVKAKPGKSQSPVVSTSSQPPTSNQPYRQPSIARRPPNLAKPFRPLPLPPEPELAKAVAVTGVIDVGGVPQAIVKAPDERVSRYVRPGQYLSNGQVLVKRIDLYPVPVVVFEELGIEVYKEVGEGVEAQPTEQAQKPSANV